MVIFSVLVMARRRKGASGSKKTAKGRKANGVSVKQINGLVSSPVNKAQLKKENSPTDVNKLGNNETPTTTSAHQEVVHKKFGKFRCLHEVAETADAQMKNTLQTSEETMKLSSDISLEQIEEVDIPETEVVWEEEVIEETVVCDGMDLEIDDDRINEEKVNHIEAALVESNIEHVLSQNNFIRNGVTLVESESDKNVGYDHSQDSQVSIQGVELEILQEQEVEHEHSVVYSLKNGIETPSEFLTVNNENSLKASSLGNIHDIEECSQSSSVLKDSDQKHSTIYEGESSDAGTGDRSPNYPEHMTEEELNLLGVDSMQVQVISDEDTKVTGEEEDEETIVDTLIETKPGLSLADLTNGKDDLISDVSLKNLGTEQRPGNFRSRSGSTDTTGSESSSSCNAVRRSNRIKSIGMRRRVRVKSDTVESIITSTEKIDIKDDKSNASVVNCETFSVLENSLHSSAKVPVALSSPMSVTIPNLQSYDSDSKPVKVKSRWRRSSELEMVTNRNCEDTTNSCLSKLTFSDVSRLKPPQSVSLPSPTVLEPVQEDDVCKDDLQNEKKEREDKEMEERLRNFTILYENEYLTYRSTSKETKRMACDCFLTREELARGDRGCGEDCLNRLLMIECGSRCTVGEKCSNKRFQKQEYAKCEVFKTEKKGFGLRALEEIPPGTFIMEYVGEVVDPKEFRRRAKEYAKDKNRHFYFMALKSDAFIDATAKGNISRFINHSCEPNAETQKWTVNGELRIGFFTRRTVSSLEEITFDYQYQRYGKEAQRCHCESATCRGWIGEDPEKEKRDRKERKEKESKKRKEEKRKEAKEYFDDMDLEEEIEKLSSSGLKNRNHTLTLCRLMVRVEDQDSRRQVLQLIQHGEPACRRLFLDYHGLRLLWSWMMDAPDLQMKTEILQTLAKLPIPNKTVLQDSKVLGMVEKWLESAGGVFVTTISEVAEDSGSGDGQVEIKKQRVCPEEVSSCENSQANILQSSVETADEETMHGIESEKQVVDQIPDLPCSDLQICRNTESEDEETEEIDDIEDVKQKFISLATNLLQEWNELKEVFRIPKKERIEQMKEHEREADRGYKEYLDKEGGAEKSYDRHWRQDRFRLDRKRTRGSPDAERMRKGARLEERLAKPPNAPNMSKHERRQLFALRVAQEEEEKRQQQEMWRQHEQQCVALGLDPNLTAAFDPQTGYPCFFDHNTGTWQSYPPEDSNSAAQPSEMRPSPMYSQSPVVHGSGLPSPHGVPSLLGMPPPGGPSPMEIPPHSGPSPHGQPVPIMMASQAIPTHVTGAPHHSVQNQGTPCLPSHWPPGHPNIGNHGPPSIPPHGPPSMQPHGPPGIPNQVPPIMPNHVPPGMPTHGPPGMPPAIPNHGPPGMPSHGPPGMPAHHRPPGMPNHGPPCMPHMPNPGPLLPGPPVMPNHSHGMMPPRPGLLGHRPPGHGPPIMPPNHGSPNMPNHRPPGMPPVMPNFNASHPPRPGLLGHAPPHILAAQGAPPHAMPLAHQPVPQPKGNGPIHIQPPLPGNPPLPPAQISPYGDPRPSPAENTVPEMIPLPLLPTPAYPPYNGPQPVETQPVPFHAVPPQPFVPPVKLPPKWKSAKDKDGRVYYYHVKTRVSQWEPPVWNQVETQPETESSSESSEEEDEDEDEDEDDEEEEVEDDDESSTGEEEDEEEEVEHVEKADDEDDEEEQEDEVVDEMAANIPVVDAPTQTDTGATKTAGERLEKVKEKKREGLVQERIISPRREEDKVDNKRYRENKEKLRRRKEKERELAKERARSESRSKKHHRESKSRSSSKTEKPVTVAADTSSDSARKIKDQFRLQMAGVIVQYLNPYRKPDCKSGRITNTEDFKHLARKLTHFVMLKELKHINSVDDLECNDNVKHKARDFVKKYMTKFGSVYQRPKDDQ